MSDLSSVVPYDPTWPDDFRRVAAAAGAALAGIQHRVEHIGSTAVPGLAAKPIIDVFVIIREVDLRDTLKALETAGWAHEGDGGIPGRESVKSRPDLPYHHLYVVVDGNEPCVNQIRFRDYLRAHPATASAYGDLKTGLEPLLRRNRDAYGEAKTDFILEVLANDRSSGWRSHRQSGSMRR